MYLLVQRKVLRLILPELLIGVPVQIKRRMWFQQNGTSSHYRSSVHHHLDRIFRCRWIGSGGLVAWPPILPDLSNFHLYFWGAMKAIVYETLVYYQMDFILRIARIAILRIVKRSVYFKMLANSCSERVNRAWMSMGGNSNTSMIVLSTVLICCVIKCLTQLSVLCTRFVFMFLYHLTEIKKQSEIYFPIWFWILLMFSTSPQSLYGKFWNILCISQ